MKRIISFCLAIFMVLAVFQGTVFAEDETYNPDDRYLWIGTPEVIIGINNYTIEMFLDVIKSYNEENIDPLNYYLEHFDTGLDDDPLKEMYISLVEGEDPLKWILMGDIDYDREITTNDARRALRMAVGLIDYYSKDSVPFMAADVDKDGEVSTADARAILRAVVGLESL